MSQPKIKVSRMKDPKLYKVLMEEEAPQWINMSSIKQNYSLSKSHIMQIIKENKVPQMVGRKSIMYNREEFHKAAFK